MTQIVVSRDERLEIVEGLANGLSLQQVTDKSDLPYAEVARVARLHGYPNRAFLANAAAAIAKGENPTEHAAPVSGVPAVSLTELLAKAQQLGLGKKADRIRDLIDQLHEEVKEKEPLAEALAELARAQAKVAALTGATQKRTRTGGDGLAREQRRLIREWAASQGREVKSPMLPKTVIAEYFAAHPGEVHPSE